MLRNSIDMVWQAFCQIKTRRLSLRVDLFNIYFHCFDSITLYTSHNEISISLLSSRLYCRFWNYTRSALWVSQGSQTIPSPCKDNGLPVGNYAPPRRIPIYFLHCYSMPLPIMCQQKTNVFIIRFLSWSTGFSVSSNPRSLP